MQLSHHKLWDHVYFNPRWRVSLPTRVPTHFMIFNMKWNSATPPPILVHSSMFLHLKKIGWDRVDGRGYFQLCKMEKRSYNNFVHMKWYNYFTLIKGVKVRKEDMITTCTFPKLSEISKLFKFKQLNHTFDKSSIRCPPEPWRNIPLLLPFSTPNNKALTASFFI